MADKNKLPKMSELESTAKPYHYPSKLIIDEDDLASIKDWKVGKKYKLEVVVKMSRARQGEEYGPINDSDSDKIHADFIVEKVLEGEEYSNEEKKEEKEEDEKEEKEAPKVVKAVKNKFLGYKE